MLAIHGAFRCLTTWPLWYGMCTLFCGHKMSLKLNDHHKISCFSSTFSADPISRCRYTLFCALSVHSVARKWSVTLNVFSNEFMYISDRSIYERNGWRDREKDPNSKLTTKLYAIAQVLGTAAVFLFGKSFFNFDRLFDPEFQQNTPFWKMMWIVPISCALCKC